MGNDKGGPALLQDHHSLLDDFFCFRIDVRGCLIQNQYLRIHIERPRKGNQLALAT